MDIRRGIHIDRWNSIPCTISMPYNKSTLPHNPFFLNTIITEQASL